ncbi:alkene reductase [Patulibacter americanus]|uniref:alkene reductase n=1 Tax=Patulibacter americanus TaxID=588672 RepID=UPI0003B5761F|nr:alkene reductase [Patulibacter americanus]
MTIWNPITAGALELPHRLAMAPMTRGRARADGVPTDLQREYYRQRASMALLVTEGIQPSDDGQGYTLTPGIYTEPHVAGWQEVTGAVHAEGGRIVAQLMHVGRVSHPDNTPHGRQSVAPSAIAAKGTMFTPTGPQDMPAPRALGTDEIPGIVAEFRAAASAAIAAGFDGVEIHGANGYLLHQFLSSNANARTDGYGGSIANRIRLATEVVSAVADEIGAERTGLRLSPGTQLNDIVEHDAHDVYPALIAALSPLNLAYLHLLHGGDEELLQTIRKAWPTTLILNRPGADLDTRIADLDSGRADVITVGTMALANPDLPARIKAGAPLNSADPATFYGGDHVGYTDYPTLEAPAPSDPAVPAAV